MVRLRTVTPKPKAGSLAPRASRAASMARMPLHTLLSLPPRMSWNSSSVADSIEM